MIFFGDSLTDQGNAFATLGAPDPSIYYEGRFTNGPNWVDILTKTVNRYPQTRVQVHNYAFGGATACPSLRTQASAPFIKDMSNQVAAFTTDVASKKVRLNGDKTLVFQFLGTNDFMDFFLNLLATNGTANLADIAQLMKDTITCRVLGAAAVAAIQGVTDIIILPLSPLHTSPAVPEAYRPVFLQIEAVVGNETLAAMNQLNETLAAAPAGTPGAGVKIWVLGSTEWISNGAYEVKPPFKYFDTPCLWSTGALVITPGIQVCSDPRHYYFYDQVHPTTKFHDWFATKGVLPRLQNLGVLP